MKSISIEMYRLVSSTILVLFLAFIVTSEAADNSSTESSVAITEGIFLLDGEHIVRFDINNALVLGCNGSDSKTVFDWYKENKNVKEVEELKNRYSVNTAENKFIIARSEGRDAGIYSCREPLATVPTKTFRAVGKPFAKLPQSVSVVEGEKVRITCAIVGSPVPNVTWYINDNLTYPITASDSRYTLSEAGGDNEAKIPNAVLSFEDITMDDRGKFTCVASNDLINVSSNSTTLLRVKDKLAALWPFLGICAEVFVLCAVILIYEKKRNKTEMEESDTDQSPDQKQADQGKDSDVRQRK